MKPLLKARVTQVVQAVIFSTLSLLASSAGASQAQPVPIPEEPSTQPQVEIDGVGIGTLDYGRGPNPARAQGSINFSDTDILVGAAQKLYNGGGVGSVGIGGLTTDESNRGFGNQLFLNQAYVDYQTETYEFLVGRAANLTAHLIDFPTLRGDDLITLTNPLDPFSNGQNVEEHRYSNVASLTVNQGLKYFENIHVQHQISSAGQGTELGINSFGLNLESLSPPGMEPFEQVPFWGLGYEHLTGVNTTSGGLHQIYVGGIINLNESVTRRWDLRLQEIVSLGSDLKEFRNITDTFQANSNDLSASVRYLSSPFGRPGYQVALTGGYKNYRDLSKSSSVGFALTGVKRLGEGFDLVAQYLGQWRDTNLAVAQASGVAFEQVGELGFIFNFNATFNQHIAPRRTLLNQKHEYIPD